MKINQLKMGVVLSYSTQFVNILSGILYTPVMLKLLGQSEYGLYQLVQSTVAYLSLLSLGFASSYMRFYSRYKVDEDTEGIAKLNGMFFTIFFVIALLCVACGGVMVANVKLIFGDGLTAAELSKSKVLMGLMVFNMAVSFINSVFKCNVTAHERFFFQRLIELLKALFNPFLTLPLLIMGYGSIGMVVISTFLTLFVFVADILYCVRKLNIRVSFKNFDFSLMKEMWVFTAFIFINMIVDQINWSVGKFLLGRIMGTVAVAVFGVAAQLNSLYLIFSSAISGVFIPRVNSIVASSGDNSELTRIFAKVGRVQFIILALILSGFILFGKPFINLWAGSQYSMAYYIGILLMAPVTVPLIQNLGIEIQRAKNLHKARSYVYLFIAVINVCISIPFIKTWGVIGAALGTALSLLIGNGIFINVYYHKKVGLDIIYFWKEILKLIPSMLIAVVIGILVKSIIPADGIVLFAINIVIYCGIYAISVWFAGMNDEEKKLLSGPIKSLLRKKKG